MKKLQLALDSLDLEDSLSLLAQVHEFIDIVEVGTPFIIRYGLEPIRCIRQQFPELYILADAKIMDAGAYEAEELFAAGANCITVLAVTDVRTIDACVNTAKKYNGQIMADMICIDDLDTVAKRLETQGVHIIAVHTGVDQQEAGRTPLLDLKILKEAVTTAKVAVAGGITRSNLADYLLLDPDIVIVGGGIIKAAIPQNAALEMAQEIHHSI